MLGRSPKIKDAPLNKILTKNRRYYAPFQHTTHLFFILLSLWTELGLINDYTAHHYFRPSILENTLSAGRLWYLINIFCSGQLILLFSLIIMDAVSPVAQLVEQMTVNHWVAGSSPARGAI